MMSYSGDASMIHTFFKNNCSPNNFSRVNLILILFQWFWVFFFWFFFFWFIFFWYVFLRFFFNNKNLNCSLTTSFWFNNFKINLKIMVESAIFPNSPLGTVALGLLQFQLIVNLSASWNVWFLDWISNSYFVNLFSCFIKIIYEFYIFIYCALVYIFKMGFSLVKGEIGKIELTRKYFDCSIMNNKRCIIKYDTSFGQ